ncbi:phosphoribosylglycinamide formyltransferase [Candidatus Sumerlaeota bacterium]|nr:phosphoribosylglycinamide formyltransferase [Candidatus Sumerlaeota bacterium]
MKLAVLASGRGSNFEAILRNAQAGRLPGVEISVLLSDKPNARALAIAREAGIGTVVIERKNHESNQAFNEAIAEELQRREIELIALAGYMRIVREPLLSAFEGRIINIHPALLPAFPGLHAQKQALDYGVRFSGCTVHFVDAGMDTGPIILQAVVPVEYGDDEDSLSARILNEEHRIYSEALALIASGRVQLDDRKVRILI